MMLRNIKLIIEYDGTNYSGWQFQPNGLSIQQVMEEGLEKILGTRVRLISSGRTDAGVHALGMVASFQTEMTIPVRAFTEGLNGLLPPDIAVSRAEEVSCNFHPLKDAKVKHYRYTIYNMPLRSPLYRHYSWHVRSRLNDEAMREAAVHFVGEHDFASFRTVGCAAKTTIRRIDLCEVSRKGEFLHIDVKGGGFLRNMVRLMAGTLIEVGQGKIQPKKIVDLLESKGKAGATAPPQGLCLVEVLY